MKLILVSAITALMAAAFAVVLAILILIASSGVWWERFWTDPNATFAGAVAIFTLGLFIVGGLQAWVTRLQYRATVALEAPVFLFLAIKLVEYADERSTVAISDKVEKGVPPAFCRILVLLSNSGRSNANITQGCLEWFVGPNLSPDPIYQPQHVQSWNAILPPNIPIWALLDRIGDVRLTPEQRDVINDRKSYLWTYGFFTYSDFKGSSFTHGFLGRWDLDQGFVREVNPKYEYKREGEWS